LKVASVPDRTFTGRIAVIGSAVAGETRVVSVKAEINNPGGVLKPGMFAELEVLTDQTSSPIVAIPASAVVEANGKKLVYVQNGNVYQGVEVSLGQTSGDMVEVKTGLFEEDIIVTQLAPQLYAQSLLGGNKAKDDGHEEAAQTQEATLASTSGLLLPWWLILAAGGAIATGTFWTGTVWANRRTQPRMATVGNSDSDTPIYYEVETYLDHNSKHPPLVDSNRPVNKHEDNH
jgi:membrane fusion protein, heavy metal efflux system